MITCTECGKDTQPDWSGKCFNCFFKLEQQTKRNDYNKVLEEKHYKFIWYTFLVGIFSSTILAATLVILGVSFLIRLF